MTYVPRSHKNKENISCNWVIGVFIQGSEIRFVTRTDRNNYCYWEEGKKPMKFDSKAYADSIAYGLCMNNFPAVVIEMPEFLTVENPKQIKVGNAND